MHLMSCPSIFWVLTLIASIAVNGKNWLERSARVSRELTIADSTSWQGQNVTRDIQWHTGKSIANLQLTVSQDQISEFSALKRLQDDLIKSSVLNKHLQKIYSSSGLLSNPGASIPARESGKHDVLQSLACCLVVALLFALSVFVYNSGPCDESTRQRMIDCNYITMQFALSSGLFSASVTVVVPESYDLVHDMGFGPTQSGLLIGSAYFMASFYGLAMRPLLKNWSQPFMRNLTIAAHCFYASLLLIYTWGADPPSWWIFQTGQARFYSCLVSRALAHCSPSYILYMMSLKAAPREQFTNVALLKVVSNIGGNAVGPLFSSFVDIVCKPGNVRARAALPQYVFIILSIFLAFSLCLRLPEELPSTSRRAHDVEKEMDIGGKDQPAPLQDDETSLPESDKRYIWIIAICFAAERKLVVAAVESATAFILELDFEWRPSKAGIVICVTLLLGLPMCVSTMRFKGLGWYTDVKVMRWATFVSTVASLLLSKTVGRILASNPNGSPWLIFAADALIYPFMYLSYGIVESLALKVSMTGSVYSLENYVFLYAMQNSVTRGLGPACARYIISRYTRDGYAGP